MLSSFCFITLTSPSLVCPSQRWLLLPKNSPTHFTPRHSLQIKPKMLAQLGLIALSALPSAVAWGTIGSQATAIVAEHFMTAATVKAVKQMLGDSSSTYLQTAATYGASYSTSKAGSWSYNDFYMCKLGRVCVSVDGLVVLNLCTGPLDEPNTYCNISFTDCTTTGCSTRSFGNWVSTLL